MQLVAGFGDFVRRGTPMLLAALLFFMLGVCPVWAADDTDTDGLEMIPTDIPIVNNDGELLDVSDVIDGNADNTADDDTDTAEDDTQQNSGADADTDAAADADADEAADTDPGTGELPELPANMQVGLYNAAAGTTHPAEVVPVNLAFDGEYTSSDVPALALNGRTLVPVRLISENLSATVDWDKATQTVTVTMGEGEDARVIVLTIGSAVALIDGAEAAVPDGVSVSLVTYGGVSRTMVPVRFVSENLGATVNYDQTQRLVDILLPEPADEPDDGDDGDDENNETAPPGLAEDGSLLRRVVIDAGHGGKDPGTNGGGYEEKIITLQTALKVQSCLEDAGYEVIMSRTDDVYPTLVERAALTVEHDAPVFVSIHCNAAENIPGANGIETYAAPDDVEDAALAGFIQQEVIAATEARDRGVKTSSLVVLTQNLAPACLVEIGFMTNEQECAKIIDDDYQQLLAEGITAGIEAYFAARED